MVLGFLLFGLLTQFRSESVATIAIVLSLAFAGELIESGPGVRFARRCGGSRRAGWGAMVGGAVRAGGGVPDSGPGGLTVASVRSVGRAGRAEIVRVDDPHQLCGERNLVSLQPVGIAGAVAALVVPTDDGLQVPREFDAREELDAPDRVHLHHLDLRGGERPGLV